MKIESFSLNFKWADISEEERESLKLETFYHAFRESPEADDRVEREKRRGWFELMMRFVFFCALFQTLVEPNVVVVFIIAVVKV